MESICCYTIHLSVRIAAQKKDFVMRSGFLKTTVFALAATAMTATTKLAHATGFNNPEDDPIEYATTGDAFNAAAPGEGDDPAPKADPKDPAPDYTIKSVPKAEKSLEDVVYDAVKDSKKYGAMVIVIHSNNQEFHTMVTNSAQENYDNGNQRIIVFSHKAVDGNKDEINMYGCGKLIGMFGGKEGRNVENLVEEIYQAIDMTYQNKFRPIYNQIYSPKNEVAATQG